MMTIFLHLWSCTSMRFTNPSPWDVEVMSQRGNRVRNDRRKPSTMSTSVDPTPPPPIPADININKVKLQALILEQ